MPLPSFDPKRLTAIVGSIGIVIAGATTATVILVTGGYKKIDVPRKLAVLTQTQRNIVALAKDYGPHSGILYVWGGSSTHGFDCSGYVSFVLHTAGVNGVPRTSFSQWHSGTYVPKGKERPGDVVFFISYGSTNNPGHVGLYIGNGKMIEYYRSGYPARLGYLHNHWGGYIGARRWWHPVQIRKHIYSTAIWVANHWGIRIARSSNWTVTYVPAAGHHVFNKTKRKKIVKWAHHNHHKTSGNRTYLNIRLH